MTRLKSLVAALLLIGSAAMAEPQRSYAPAEFRELGYQALSAGHPADALKISDALLGRDPGDLSAQILRSRALRALGQHDEAARVGAGAYAAAPDAQGRYGAALATAQALASGEKRSRAQFWLRRAVQNATNDTQRQIAIRDFDYVRSRNPLAYDFTFRVAPSSNVNGGASKSVVDFLGLPFVLGGSALALSGTEITMGAALRWRLPMTETSETEFRLSGQSRQVMLSDEARRKAPGARGSDYALNAVELGARRLIRFGGGRSSLSLDASLGRNWYGGDPLSSYAKAEVGLGRVLAPGLSGRLSFGAERQWRDDDRRRNATVHTLRGGLTKALANRDLISLSLQQRRSLSQSTSIDHRAVLAELSWQKAEPLAGIEIGAGISGEWRTYDAFPWTVDGRKDTRLSGRLSLTFTKVELFGFSPVLDLSASHNDSSFDFYDSREIGVSLGISSSF